MPTMPRGRRGSGYAIAWPKPTNRRYSDTDHGPRCLVCMWPTIAAAELDPPIHPTCTDEHRALIPLSALAVARTRTRAAHVRAV